MEGISPPILEGEKADPVSSGQKRRDPKGSSNATDAQAAEWAGSRTPARTQAQHTRGVRWTPLATTGKGGTTFTEHAHHRRSYRNGEIDHRVSGRASQSGSEA